MAFWQNEAKNVHENKGALLDQAHCKWCKVISGGQLKRTGTIDVPTPAEV
jgi:hypothetical protein